VEEPPRRRALTPLESELRFYDQRERAPGRLVRLRSWRRSKRRKPPTTLRGAIAWGLVRLVIVVGVATGFALLLDHWTGRSAEFGFYVAGALILGAGLTLSEAGLEASDYYYGQDERERRVSTTFSYALAGLIVFGIAIAVDALSV
jgi:hypothetical protein